ncbi:alternative ribosome rescue aminoacyl-tRNA hydrolase ArfB [Algibacter sp. 2305UL17-15]|uniref:alternative ribosome rescue aminoacyl-tRNA hydrolase ArfB n=1 Tax=Algibacter sp. 2305UL17-15 TaxID=3231268 RepID=UPI003459B9C2
MIDEETLVKELTFKGIRSSGSGGQHVNKVASKVELTFDLNASLVFNDAQKLLLQEKLQNRLTNEGLLMLQCGESRSQHRNKEIVTRRFLELIKTSLIVPKKRRPTKIPRSAIRKRLKNKRSHSGKKANRRKPDID